jgi:hypothetical protein
VHLDAGMILDRVEEAEDRGRVDLLIFRARRAAVTWP